MGTQVSFDFSEVIANSRQGWRFGRQTSRLTPHPGPLPIEGRGSRAARFQEIRTPCGDGIALRFDRASN
jgi:hypothetical protein